MRRGLPGWIEYYSNQSVECGLTLQAFVKCLVAASCEEWAVFFDGYPDEVQEGDSCADEYSALECTDFEFRTEYSAN